MIPYHEIKNFEAADWKRIEVPERAAELYRRHTLRQKDDEPPLKVRIDIREDMEDQEGRIINFYKVTKIDWARPLQCRLEGTVTVILMFKMLNNRRSHLCHIPVLNFKVYHFCRGCCHWGWCSARFF